MKAVRARALRDAATLAEGGVDGVLVENFGDVPFYPRRVPPETVAALAVTVAEVVEAVGVPVGVNVLRNDARAALAIAAATGARFLRVNVHLGLMFTDQGAVEGQAHETLRRRRELGIEPAILADLFVKHAVPPPGLGLEAAARDHWERGLADALLLTGPATGAGVEVGEVARVRRILPPEAPLWVASGVTARTAPAFLEVADGLIVGSAFQRDGRAGGGVEGERVRTFMKALGR